jgi:hypothetical protein
MIKCLLKHFTFNTILVAISFVGLLPPKVYKHVFRIVMLDPINAMAHKLPDERTIVTQPDVELPYLNCTLCLSSPRIFDLCMLRLDSIKWRDLDFRGTTLRFCSSGSLIGLFRRRSSERMEVYTKPGCTLRILY